ncbi:hypothetical protein ABZZ79_13290 [Streptomyces sp. NPDC006458]|uniref:DUF6891 domain-containing protein n=1 Tax=Streptomyces sp. NPDC006458 TaxID=3154302 RepID=UPI0033AAFFCA
MDIKGGPAVKAWTEHGETYLRPAEDRLGELVRRIGEPGDRWIVVQRVPDLPDVFAQVWHEDGGDYRLEHRAGADDFHGTNLTDVEQVASLLIGWARQTEGWDAGPAWAPIDMGPDEDVPELPDAVREQLEEHVRLRLACGYATRSGLAETAEDFLVDGDERPVSGAQARRLVDRLWLERVAEMATWRGVTDPERITRSFAALEGGGITARENFTCCRSCGMAEIGAEREDARGFVFFHQQVTEHAAEGHGLVLHYGGFDGSEATTTAVGREVVAALTAAGLSTDWDGNPGKAISVEPLNWLKRLVGYGKWGLVPGRAGVRTVRGGSAPSGCLLQWAHGQLPEDHRDGSP